MNGGDPTRGGLAVEARELFALAWPMMIAQAGLTAMGLVDTAMIGRVSAVDMSAVGLGSALATFVMVLGLGLLTGLEPLVAQATGAGEGGEADRWLGQGRVMALRISAPMVALLLLAAALLEPLGIEPHIAAPTRTYLLARLPGLVANALYAAYRAYLTGLQVTRPILIGSVVANVVNAILDAVLLFVFDLGALGVGLATSACWILMLALVA